MNMKPRRRTLTFRACAVDPYFVFIRRALMASYCALSSSTVSLPSEQEWQVLLTAAEKILSWKPETLLPALEQIGDRVLAARNAMDALPRKEQVSDLIRLLRDLRTTFQPDGSRSVRNSSPRTSASELWEFTKKLLLIILIVLVTTTALCGLLWGLFTVWRAFRTLRP